MRLHLYIFYLYMFVCLFVLNKILGFCFLIVLVCNNFIYFSLKLKDINKKYKIVI